MVVGQVHEVGGAEFRIEFFLQNVRIGQAQAEGDDGARIAEDGVTDLLFKLAQELVGQDEVEAVFPRSGSMLAKLSVAKVGNSSG